MVWAKSVPSKTPPQFRKFRTTWEKFKMNKLLFAMLAASALFVLPSSSQATPGSTAPGFTNSIVQREANEAPRQEDRQQDRRQDRRQDRQNDRL
jgi:hypothetical protein